MGSPLRLLQRPGGNKKNLAKHEAFEEENLERIMNMKIVLHEVKIVKMKLSCNKGQIKYRKDERGPTCNKHMLKHSLFYNALKIPLENKNKVTANKTEIGTANIFQPRVSLLSQSEFLGFQRFLGFLIFDLLTSACVRAFAPKLRSRLTHPALVFYVFSQSQPSQVAKKTNDSRFSLGKTLFCAENKALSPP